MAPSDTFAIPSLCFYSREANKSTHAKWTLTYRLKSLETAKFGTQIAFPTQNLHSCMQRREEVDRDNHLLFNQMFNDLPGFLRPGSELIL